MGISELNTMQEYRELFEKHFNLSFKYGVTGKYYCYIKITRTDLHYDIVYAEAFGDDFDECLGQIQKRLYTYGLSPDSSDPGPFPPFSSPNEFKMKLELRGNEQNLYFEAQ